MKKVSKLNTSAITIAYKFGRWLKERDFVSYVSPPTSGSIVYKNKEGCKVEITQKGEVYFTDGSARSMTNLNLQDRNKIERQLSHITEFLIQRNLTIIEAVEIEKVFSNIKTSKLTNYPDLKKVLDIIKEYIKVYTFIDFWYNGNALQVYNKYDKKYIADVSIRNRAYIVEFVLLEQEPKKFPVLFSFDDTQSHSWHDSGDEIEAAKKAVAWAIYKSKTSTHHMHKVGKTKLSKLMQKTDPSVLEDFLKEKANKSGTIGYKKLGTPGNITFEVRDIGITNRVCAINVLGRFYFVNFYNRGGTPALNSFDYLAGEEKRIVDRAFDFVHKGFINK